jgi:hypothetical protein
LRAFSHSVNQKFAVILDEFAAFSIRARSRLAESFALCSHARMPNRCRLCTSNDRDALVDEMAANAWEAARYGESWEAVREPWKSAFRHHANLMLQALERDHG